MVYELDLEEDQDVKGLREILTQKNKIIDVLEGKIN